MNNAYRRCRIRVAVRKGSGPKRVAVVKPGGLPDSSGIMEMAYLICGDKYVRWITISLPITIKPEPFTDGNEPFFQQLLCGQFVFKNVFGSNYSTLNFLWFIVDP